MVEANMKGLGQAAYPLASLGLLSEVRGAKCQVVLDGEAINLPLLAAVITNVRLYGGLVPLVPSARVDDGVLDVVLFEGSDPFQLAAHVAKVLAGQHERDANIHVCRARSIRIVSRGRPLPIQADGDLRGTTPAEVVIEPGAVLALAVPDARPSQRDRRHGLVVSQTASGTLSGPLHPRTIRSISLRCLCACHQSRMFGPAGLVKNYFPGRTHPYGSVLMSLEYR